MESRRARNRRMKKIAVLLRILFGSIFVAICLLIGVGVNTLIHKQGENRKATQKTEKETEVAEKEASLEEQTQRAIEEAQEAASVSLNEAENAESEPAEDELLMQKVDEKLAKMSLDEKIAQMFFVTAESLTGVKVATAAGDKTKEQMEKYPVGGIIYFAQNFEDGEQTKEMLQNTQEYAMETEGMPLFLGVDEEGGNVLRIGNNPGFFVQKTEPMGELAKAGETAVYEAASTIATYLSEYGLNVNFAPDADVLVNADNEVIGDRSFGNDPEKVKELTAVYANAMHEHGVMACYKHFPGHGGTVADSHTGAASLDRSIDQLRETEFLPFADAGKEGVEFVMVSHISVPKVTLDDTPASLSKKMVTDLLRGELGYEGIIITDALDMGAISEKYDVGEAAVKAVEAGCDMLLMPKDLKASYDAILAAVQAGDIKKEQIDASVRRILKEKMKLLDAQE